MLTERGNVSLIMDYGPVHTFVARVSKCLKVALPSKNHFKFNQPLHILYQGTSLTQFNSIKQTYI